MNNNNIDILSSYKILLYDLEVLDFYFSFNYSVVGSNDLYRVNTRINTIDEIRTLFNRIKVGKNDVILVAHNNVGYDGVIVDYLCDALFDGRINNIEHLIEQTYQLSQDIQSNGRMSFYKIRRDYGIQKICNLFDSYEFFDFGLKEIACRIGRANIIETDFDNITIENFNYEEFIKYENEDVYLLQAIWDNNNLSYNLKEELIGKLLLIEHFNLDLKDVAKKKAELGAETVLKQNCEKNKYPKMWTCKMRNLTFTNPQLQEVYKRILSFNRPLESKNKTDKLSISFSIIMKTGKELEITIGEGGLHGAIKNLVSKIGGIDIDASSYYPMLMILFDYLPDNVDKEKFKSIIYDRLKYKKDGNSLAGVFKIVINAIFGMMKYRNGIIYAPDKFLDVTIGGQLLLLKLMDMMLEKGIDVYYLNTDGITIENTDVDYNSIIEEWVKMTGIDCEIELFKEMYLRSVNHYINVKENGKLKSKGFYSLYHDKKSYGFGRVIIQSLHNYLKTGVSPKDYVKERSKIGDIREFCFYNKGQKTKQYLWLDKLESKEIKVDCPLTNNTEKKLYYYFNDYHNLLRVNRWIRIRNSNACIREWDKQSKDWREFNLVTAADKVLMMNNITDFKACNYDLDLAYYYSKCDEHMEKLLGLYEKNEVLGSYMKELGGVMIES